MKIPTSYKTAVFCVVFICIVEALCGAAIHLSYRISGTPKRISKFRFHPLLTSENILEYETSWREDFPVYGYTNRIFTSPECGFTTDQYGWIHNGDKARVISPETFTIFIVGGGTAAGHGSSCNNQTISAHLEKLIQKDHPEVMVINAAVSGYTVAQELLKISNEILFYDPDVIISLGGANEFKSELSDFKGRQHTEFISSYDRTIYKTLEDTHSLAWSLKNTALHLFNFTQYTYTRFILEKGISSLSRKMQAKDNGLAGHGQTESKEPVHYSDASFADSMDKKLEHYVRYVTQAHAIVTGMGKKYYAILHPVLLTEHRKLPPAEEKILNDSHRAHYLKTGADLVARANYYWEKAGTLLRDQGIPTQDFTSVFPDQESVYLDEMHFNDNGNAIIAQNLYSQLIRDKILPIFQKD